MAPSAFAVLAIGSFVAMEPLTAAIHRFVMHGLGAWLHRSHHEPSDHGWERNDWYPVAFAAVVMLGFWLGFHDDAMTWLLPVGLGVTIYGGAYALVHDGYIHRRVDLFGSRVVRPLDRLAAAHRIHHRYGRAPFGMLAPIVPSDLRARAGRADGDPLPRRARTA